MSVYRKCGNTRWFDDYENDFHEEFEHYDNRFAYLKYLGKSSDNWWFDGFDIDEDDYPYDD